ncbi:MAG: hypothetical protein Q4P66_07035 [Actinomycetaceae bacterium]|nr:hypothetical protein [Actinomycetaceae bacterium]
MTRADKPGQRTWFVGDDDEKQQANNSGDIPHTSSTEGISSLADEVFGRNDTFGEDEPTGPIFTSFDTNLSSETTEENSGEDNGFTDNTDTDGQATSGYLETTEGDRNTINHDEVALSHDAAPGRPTAYSDTSDNAGKDVTTQSTDNAHDSKKSGLSSRLFSSEESSSLEETAAMTPVDDDEENPESAPEHTKDSPASHSTDNTASPDGDKTSTPDTVSTDKTSEDISDISPERARQSVVEQLHTPISDDEVESTLIHRQSLLNEADASPSDNETTQEARTDSEPEWKTTTDSVTTDNIKRVSPSAVDEAIFEGATVRPAVPSRAGAHLWSFILFLLLVPITWYLTWDAGTRLTLAKNAQWDTGMIDPLAVSELGAGAVCLFILILVARWSSLGAFIMGIVTMGCGVPFVVLPAVTHERLAPVLESLNNAGPFTGNIAHHLEWSGSTGFFIFAGVAMISLGFVSHGARRKGRKDFLTKRRVEREKRKQGIKD